VITSAAKQGLDPGPMIRRPILLIALLVASALLAVATIPVAADAAPGDVVEVYVVRTP